MRRVRPRGGVNDERLSDAFWDWLSGQVDLWSDMQLMLVDGQERRRWQLLMARALGKAARYLVRPAPSTSGSLISKQAGRVIFFIMSYDIAGFHDTAEA